MALCVKFSFVSYVCECDSRFCSFYIISTWGWAPGWQKKEKFKKAKKRKFSTKVEGMKGILNYDYISQREKLKWTPSINWWKNRVKKIFLLIFSIEYFNGDRNWMATATKSLTVLMHRRIFSYKPHGADNNYSAACKRFQLFYKNLLFYSSSVENKIWLKKNVACTVAAAFYTSSAACVHNKIW